MENARILVQILLINVIKSSTGSLAVGGKTCGRRSIVDLEAAESTDVARKGLSRIHKAEKGVPVAGPATLPREIP